MKVKIHHEGENILLMLFLLLSACTRVIVVPTASYNGVMQQGL